MLKAVHQNNISSSVGRCGRFQNTRWPRLDAPWKNIVLLVLHWWDNPVPTNMGFWGKYAVCFLTPGEFAVCFLTKCAFAVCFLTKCRPALIWLRLVRGTSVSVCAVIDANVTRTLNLPCKRRRVVGAQVNYRYIRQEQWHQERRPGRLFHPLQLRLQHVFVRHQCLWLLLKPTTSVSLHN